MNPEHVERVSQLLAFLSAYDARRHPPVRNIADYRLELLRDSDVPASTSVQLTGGGEVWLGVDFVELPKRPPVPDRLVEILGSTSRISATVAPVVTLPSAEDASSVESGDPPEPTDEQLELLAEAENWVSDVWRPWSARYLEANAVKRLHRRLFELREQYSADRDALELVWGFGRLRWRPDGVVIDHPLLTVPVEVDMVPDSSRIEVRPAGGLAVETAYLSDIPVDDRPHLNRMQQFLLDQEEPEDPWVTDTRRDLIVRLLRSIDQDGVIEGEGEAGPGDAVADLSWVLYLRRRRPDYQGFLDGMRALYEAGIAPPDPLLAIVADEPSLLEEERAARSQHSPEPLLLPLATNEQQQRILTEIQRRTGITVQGPPGTGKSHTIANIISHYVAYGKRVLVVAEKEQALGVVAEKVPSEIRDLTVSVLGADDVGRRRLESSIRAIQARVTTLNRADAAEDIERNTRELDRIDREIAATTSQLLACRRDEVRVVAGAWQAGHDPTPSRVGEWLARNESQLAFIDDHVALGTPPPLTSPELRDLVQLLDEVGLERARAAAYTLPDATHLPDGRVLESGWAELLELRSTMRGAGGEAVDWARVDESDDAELAALLSLTATEREWLDAERGTWLERLSVQLDDVHLAPEWSQFRSGVEASRLQIIELCRTLDAHVINVPLHFDASFAAHLEAARSRLKDRGRLGLFDGDAKRAIENCTVDGRTPSSSEDVALCLDALRRSDLRRQLIAWWSNRTAHVEGPLLDGPAPEIALGPRLEELDRVLGRAPRLAALNVRLQQAGISAPPRPDAAALASLQSLLQSTAYRRRERQLQRYLDQLAEYLARGAGLVGASPLWHRLRESLAVQEAASWDAARLAAEDLARVSGSGARLRELHERLYRAAPVWASRVVADRSVVTDPELFEAAWEWRQLEAHTKSMVASANPSDLQHQLEQLADRRRRVVTELVADRAWLRLAENLGDRQLQALNAYLAAVRRFGKTGGKFAARWLAEIRRALNDSKDAVPVWIMTTSRALASFRPSETPPFDLLIIDEASQIGLQAIPLFSLARTTIVVGDDKQTSPETVGVDESSHFDLLDEYLRSVRNYKLLFALGQSLYDIAQMKFPARTMLTEHFRCLPEIIEFSNAHVYDGRIIPLRDQPPVPGWCPLGSLKVLDGYRSGDINEPEANAVVDLIEKLCADPDYDDMDFGVVSLLGSTQSKLIWDRLYDRLGPEVLASRRIRCGEPANFQGDERDVMVLSLVVATDPNNPRSRLGAMTKVADQRRVNVAASRAREQMWVVSSVDADRFSDGDLRGALIRHCQSPGDLRAEREDLLSKCDSEFERLVVRRILARGYRRVRVQHPVGRYRLDIVVEGPDARLAVECDGDAWHGPDRWHQDRARQEVLERAGWTFERIRGSAFFRDPDAALMPLWQRLDALGIATGEDARVESSRSIVLEVSGAGARALEEPSGEESPSDEIAGDPDAGTREVEEDLPALRRDSPRSPVEHGAERSVPVLTRDDVLPPAPTLGVPVAQSALLRPFAGWKSQSLPEAAFARDVELIDGLVEIVSAEGPMHALRAYQLYVKASGGQRVGRELRRVFNRAMHRAVTLGRLKQVDDDLPGQADKTVFAPDSAPVVMRSLGTRTLLEVPRSEMRALATALGYEGPTTEAKRAVLKSLGLTKLTERSSAYLDECFAYVYRPPAGG